MADPISLPQPLFDTLESLEQNEAPLPDYVSKDDFAITRGFLLSYRGSPDTYHSYRREVDRFLQWVYLIARMPLTQLGREDIENYIRFCQKPPNSWIATKMVARFIVEDGDKRPNREVAALCCKGLKRGSSRWQKANR